MRVITIDCARVTSAESFWDAYVAAALPEGRGYFGRNLAAFWDAVSAGGPGWPGDDCELRLVNTAPLKLFGGGKFYASLKDLAERSRLIPIHVE